MAAKLFSSQNKRNSSEHDSLTLCNMHLTQCNMQKILHGYSSASEWEFFFKYIIRLDITCESSTRQRIHMKHQALFS